MTNSRREREKKKPLRRAEYAMWSVIKFHILARNAFSRDL